MRKEDATPFVIAICKFQGNIFEISYAENDQCRVLKNIHHISHNQYDPEKVILLDEEEVFFTLFTFTLSGGGNLFCRCGDLYFGMNRDATKTLNPVKDKTYIKYLQRFDGGLLKLKEIPLTSLLEHFLKHILVLEPSFAN